MRIPLLLSQSPGLLLKSALYVKQEAWTRPGLTRSARVQVEELLLVFGASGGYCPWASVVCERPRSRGVTEKAGGATRPRCFASHCRLERSPFPWCLAPGRGASLAFLVSKESYPRLPHAKPSFLEWLCCLERMKGWPQWLVSAWA